MLIDASSFGAGGIVGSTINVNFNGKREELGDHSILVDASSSGTSSPANSSSPSNAASTDAGIHSSTINLTVISRLKRAVLSLLPSPHVRRAIHPTLRARQAGFVSDLAAQESAYAAAVAALGALPTAAPVAAATGVVSTEDIKMLAIVDPLLDPLAAPTPSSEPLGADILAVLPPLTLTMTLVAGPSGYVDAAGQAPAAVATAAVESVGTAALLEEKMKRGMQVVRLARKGE